MGYPKILKVELVYGCRSIVENAETNESKIKIAGPSKLRPY
jgi:hypothetical protein